MQPRSHDTGVYDLNGKDDKLVVVYMDIVLIPFFLRDQSHIALCLLKTL